MKVTIHPADRSVRFRIEAFLASALTLETLQRCVWTITHIAEKFFEVEATPKELKA